MDLIELITNGWTIGGIVSLLVMILAKVLPEEKVSGKVSPIFYNAGVFVSRFLILRIGKKSTEKFETGIIRTLMTVLIRALSSFLNGMLSDNIMKKPK